MLYLLSHYDVFDIKAAFINKRWRKPKGKIKNGQFRETGNIGYTRHKTETSKIKNTTQHVLDTTMRKQTQIT